MYARFVTSPDLQLMPTGFSWITHVVDACHDQIISCRMLIAVVASIVIFSNRVISGKYYSHMAFFSSCGGQEVYEYRLKRSSSTTSVRSRSRRPSGSQKLSSQSRVRTHTPPLPRAETSDDVSSTRHNPSTASPSPSHTPALDAREQSMRVVP